MMSRAQVVLALIALCGGGVLLQAADGAVSLEHLSTVYLPSRYTPSPEYQYDTEAAEQSAYSPTQKYIYTVGNNILHVIDATDARNMKTVFHKENSLGDVTDVEVCGQFVVIAVDNKARPLEGAVIIYRLYDPTTSTLEMVNQITVGALPDMVKLTHDCRKIIVAIEGEVRTYAGQVIDPEAGVGIIEFDTTDLSGNFQFRVADFKSFNARADEYISRGVRWVWRGEGAGITNTFSQDLEPEYVTLNKDESKAYISLQENNAIAVVNIATATVEEIYPLGYKDWSKSRFDASDRDNEVNLQAWNVRGLYQPDSIKFITIQGKDYILTANEGDYKKFESPDFNFEWRESKKGKDFYKDGEIDDRVSDTLRDQLATNEQLGRLKLSTVDGRTADDTYNQFYTYGARSMSLFRASDLTIEWDSGSRLEEDILTSFPNIFNSNGKDASLTPSESKDTRSDNMGPESESITYGTINGKLYVFVGVERPGMIAMYSVPDSGPVDLVFEGMHYAGGTGKSYEELWSSREGRDIDPEDIRFLTAADSPSGQPCLLVSGSVSGTVSMYNIKTSSQDKPAENQYIHPLARGTSSLRNPNASSAYTASIAAICLASVALVASGFVILIKFKKERKGSSTLTDSKMHLPDLSVVN